jgi:hypothetical protein
MRLVQVYIEGNKIELFEDEQINVTSSVQNIADISKVFTDFSQGFTVPASTVNNAIFEHFYQSDIDGTIDHNIRRNAVIEIDLTTFRRGKIQIEKANVKNGKAENYTLTFYGDIRTLKDAFGEDMINQLDLTSLEFTYNGTEIYDRITDLTTDYDVRYPLIANTRLWTYNDSGPEDITQNAHAINYSELFPAVKISKLFDAIQNDYGVTFQGTFLSDPRFTDAFLYGKNTNEHTFITEAKDLDFVSKTNNNDANWSNISTSNAEDFVDLTTNLINIKSFDTQLTKHKIEINITAKSAAGTIYIDVFQDGNYWQTLQTTTTGIVGYGISFLDVPGLDTNIQFQFKGSASMNIDAVVTYTATAVYVDTITLSWVQTTSASVITTNQTVLSGNVSINQTLPEIKISDFFAGVLKMFNMTCVGISENVYEVLPLDEWYSQGAIVDITQYTDIDSIDIERIKLYKKIAFKYQQSESFVNKNYFKLANSEYGDMSYQFAYDGEEYNVEVPFENLLFTRALDTGTDYAILGYCLDTSYNPYTPKPVILYLYGMEHTLTHNIKFFDGVTNLNISSYVLFGQDLTYQNEKYSLNFGADNSIIHLETIQQGLYAQYYFPYLLNLYSKKNRLTYVKTNLPISLLTNLKLNDRLIIRDKRYIINEMKSNLTTGEVNFSLYLDFRQLEAGQVLTPSKDEQCLEIPIRFINGALQADITTDFAGVTITPSTIYNAQTIEVCIPANPNSPAYLLAENSDNLTSEEWQNIITEESSVQVIVLTITYTFGDGSTTTQTITIIQQ